MSRNVAEQYCSFVLLVKKKKKVSQRELSSVNSKKAPRGSGRLSQMKESTMEKVEGVPPLGRFP